MDSKKHPLDIAAGQLEALADAPSANQPSSANFWEFRCATDDTVGDYPQAIFQEMPDWGDSEGLGADGFPSIPIPPQILQPAAKWTDVLSSSLWPDGYLVNEKALAAFKRVNLGNFRQYPACVSDQKGKVHSLVYLHLRNIVEPDKIDFARSRFHVADILGMPGDPIDIQSFADWERNLQLAMDGELNGCDEFSSLEYSPLHFIEGFRPPADVFQIARLDTTVYASAKLRAVMLEESVTDVNFKENRKLVA